MKKFTAKEIEPFVTVTHRAGAFNRGVLVAVLGVALQKADSKWQTHELSDEIDGDSTRRLWPVPGEHARGKAVSEMKRRLLDALNRLREHYERVYVYVIRM
jgi:hypothetical protein